MMQMKMPGNGMPPPHHRMPPPHHQMPMGKGNSMHGIISRRPGFTVRFALPAVLMILVLVVGSAWMIHYPQTIASRAIIYFPPEPGASPYADVSIQKEHFVTIRAMQSVRFFFKSGPYAGKGLLTGDFKFILSQDPGDDLKIRILLPGIPAGQRETKTTEQGDPVDILIVVRNMRLLERVLYKPDR